MRPPEAGRPRPRRTTPCGGGAGACRLLSVVSSLRPHSRPGAPDQPVKLADATTDGAGCAVWATAFDRDGVACAPRTPLLDDFAGADAVTLAVAGSPIRSSWSPAS